MTRPQFNIRTLLWLTLVVAAFFAGKKQEQQRLEADRRAIRAEAKYNFDWQMHLFDERDRLAAREKRLHE